MLKTQYIKKLSEAQITPKEVTISGNCSEIESKQTLHGHVVLGEY
jgi:hypothetical protein